MKSLYASDLIRRYCSGMRSEYDNERGVVYPNRQDHNIIHAFDSGYDNPNAEKILYMYVPEKPLGFSAAKQKANVSLITKTFTDNPRSQNKNMGRVARVWDGKLEIRHSVPPLSEIYAFLKKWNENSGAKYGMRNSSSYDKNFFTNHQDIFWKAQTLFFYNEGRLVGYSIIEKPNLIERDDGYLVARYGPGKCDITVGSNISQYIDYMAFKVMRDTIGEDFLIHWGTADKGVVEYERRNFPFYREDTYYTYTTRPRPSVQRKLF